MENTKPLGKTYVRNVNEINNRKEEIMANGKGRTSPRNNKKNRHFCDYCGRPKSPENEMCKRCVKERKKEMENY